MIVKNFAIRMEYGALLVYIKIFIHRGDFMEEVNLQEMLAARERRCYLQTQLLHQYKKSLISFTLNIPGPVKVLTGVPEASIYFSA